MKWQMVAPNNIRHNNLYLLTYNIRVVNALRSLKLFYIIWKGTRYTSQGNDYVAKRKVITERCV